MEILNPFHAADNHKMFKKIKKCQNSGIWYGDYIWNHHEKCIQISTNMPDIGLEICEILSILYGW